MSKETITTTSDNSFAPKITDIHNSKIALKFEGNCLKQDKVSFAQRNMVNIFVVYEVNTWSRNLKSDFTFKGCLFGAVN